MIVAALAFLEPNYFSFDSSPFELYFSNRPSCLTAWSNHKDKLEITSLQLRDTKFASTG